MTEAHTLPLSYQCRSAINNLLKKLQVHFRTSVIGMLVPYLQHYSPSTSIFHYNASLSYN